MKADVYGIGYLAVYVGFATLELYWASENLDDKYD
jgi:hypothetical protein